jgi:Protein of unknown function (DUF1572)
MDNSLAKHYLDDALTSFRDYKALAEKAFAQLKDEEFFLALDEEANSIGVIIKHMSGNMRSRWTDFLSSDGEKQDRNRDAEFMLTDDVSRDGLMEQWEEGWSRVFGAIEPLQPEDLGRKVLIRGEEHSVIEAVNRQLTHYAYHTGQIVFLAKHIRSADWKSLSIPRNRSAEFNVYLKKKNTETDETARQKRFSSSQDFIRDSE